MAATFGTPLAATLLAVELLLFEWKPRSFGPVALACASAMATRHFLFESATLFPVSAPVSGDDVWVLLGCVAAGVGAGLLSVLMTKSVYLFDDPFQRLRVHWMVARARRPRDRHRRPRRAARAGGRLRRDRRAPARPHGARRDPRPRRHQVGDLVDLARPRHVRRRARAAAHARRLARRARGDGAPRRPRRLLAA